MPFESEAQRRLMWMKHPRIAERWSHEHPESNKGLPYHKKHKKAAELALKAADIGGYLAVPSARYTKTIKPRAGQSISAEMDKASSVKKAGPMQNMPNMPTDADVAGTLAALGLGGATAGGMLGGGMFGGAVGGGKSIVPGALAGGGIPLGAAAGGALAHTLAPTSVGATLAGLAGGAGLGALGGGALGRWLMKDEKRGAFKKKYRAKKFMKKFSSFLRARANSQEKVAGFVAYSQIADAFDKSGSILAALDEVFPASPAQDLCKVATELANSWREQLVKEAAAREVVCRYLEGLEQPATIKLASAIRNLGNFAEALRATYPEKTAEDLKTIASKITEALISNVK